MKIFVTAMVALVALAVPAKAEETPLKMLMTGDDSRGWEAVGRLDIAGTAFCTGALIAPDLVLTAAHCLFDKSTGKRVNATSIEFLAGWRNGRATAYRSVVKAVPHPEFVFQGGDRVSRISHDVALLKLDQPVRNTSVTPFEIGDRPRKGAEVGVVSYARERSESPSLQKICHVLARQSGTLVLSCDVDFGSSGAPVFHIDADGSAQIVSVVSAKAEVRGLNVALGTSLEQPLQDLMRLIDDGDAVVADAQPTVKVRKLNTTQNDGGGAKFLRP